MAILTSPLSASEVQKAKPGATEYELFNGQGLILSVRSSGNIIWCFRYKRSGSASGTTITLRYFPAISPASAWILHAEHPALLFKSIDPKNWNRKK
ncbi:TPA: integrase arm-type DNA-binding domain-containing protein [Salmonella enterica]